VAVAILDQVEEFDQEIAPALPGAEQLSDLSERARLDLAAFRGLPGAPPRCWGLFSRCAHKDAATRSHIT
jgi:hypothetical protein